MFQQKTILVYKFVQFNKIIYFAVKNKSFYSFVVLLWPYMCPSTRALTKREYWDAMNCQGSAAACEFLWWTFYDGFSVVSLYLTDWRYLKDSSKFSPMHGIYYWNPLIRVPIGIEAACWDLRGSELASFKNFNFSGFPYQCFYVQSHNGHKYRLIETHLVFSGTFENILLLIGQCIWKNKSSNYISHWVPLKNSPFLIWKVCNCSSLELGQTRNVLFSCQLFILADGAVSRATLSTCLELY